MENKLRISSLKKNSKLGLFNDLINLVKNSEPEVKAKYKRKCREELWVIEGRKDFGWEYFEGLYDFMRKAELGDEFYHQESERVFYRLWNFISKIPEESRMSLLCHYEERLQNISKEHFDEYLGRYLSVIPIETLDIFEIVKQ